MKVYIIKKAVENEYNIFTVSDNLVSEFEDENKEAILISGSSIQDVMIQFSVMEKEPETPFNPVLKRVKGEVQ